MRSQQCLMSEFTIKDKVAIAGLGETSYYKRGGAPVSEFRLALEAIQRAAADAGIPVTAIDGIASYSNDRNDSIRVATALGLPELRFSNMFWAEAVVEAQARSATPLPRLWQASRPASSSIEHSRRASSAASGRLPRSARSPVRPRTHGRMGCPRPHNGLHSALAASCTSIT